MLYLCRISENMIESVDYKRIFEQLFRENYARLYYHAYSFLNDEESAKDVVNDVFERVWINFEKVEFSTSILPLLYTLVRNRCVSYIRHRRVQERFTKEMLQEEEKVDEEYMEYELLIEKLRHSVEQLPGQTKVVFKKCFLDGRKYQEAADELNISINTVKTHINKALKLLRSRFAGDEIILIVFLLGK